MTDPVARFRELAGRHDRMFWLDGGGSREWSGRRSLLGALGPDDISLTYNAARREVLRHRGGRCNVAGDDVFDALEEAVAADDGDPAVHWVGYLGYACRADLPARVAPAGPARVPDAVWMRVRDPLVVDHPAVLPPMSEVERAENATKSVPTSEVPEWYAAAFAAVREQLHAGNTYEVNLTYREALTSGVDPAAAYLRLRDLSPAPYAGFLRHGATRLLSSSPEWFATIDRRRWLETKPIKGTTPRGRTTAADEAHRAALATDPRYRAENLMIVDLLRNDLSTVCEPGTVTVPELMAVESYAGVHQLVSTVRGHLREAVSTVGALRALFPAGSMTGAPKLRTMEVIRAVEVTARGVYSGAFGWLSADGRADLGVVIRSLVATPEDDGWRYELGTGGGVTVRSDAASEYAETTWKAARLRAAVAP
ncbi:MAG: anthranilate synthase component I family protein [Nocardioidaceae bacterium]